MYTTLIPHLPDEIHLLIGQFVHQDDLPSYRLASKLLHSIGTAELFGTLTFHYSTTSLAHLASISNSEHLRKHVKTVIWDVNLWRIPNVRDLVEWETYFYQKATSLRTWYDSALAEAHASRLELLAQNRKEWEAYLDKMDDEKTARRDPSLLGTLGRFYNLHTIHVVHGQLVTAHRGVKKVGDDEAHSASVAQPVALGRGEGMKNFGSHVGEEALDSLVKIQTLQLTKLKLTRIRYTNFVSWPWNHFENLKSLDIKITVRADNDDGGLYGVVFSPRFFHQGKLHFYLSRLLLQLECIKIDMDCGYEETNITLRQPCANIEDAFGISTIWPRLRKLSLCHFFATPETLISLLTRHRGTLRGLQLRNITLTSGLEETPSSSKPDNSGDDSASLVVSVRERGWPEILRHLAVCLDLQHVTLSGKLDVRISGKEAWDLDADPAFAAAISDYLVRGGECPW